MKGKLMVTEDKMVCFPEDEITKAEEDVQKLTDAFIKKVDELLEKKEKEIMTV